MKGFQHRAHNIYPDMTKQLRTSFLYVVVQNKEYVFSIFLGIIYSPKLIL